MKRRVAAVLLGACLLWAALPTLAQGLRDSRQQRIDDPLRAQFPQTEPLRSDEAMRATIRTAASAKGWRVESDSPSRMELSLQVREHRARVEVTYLGTGYVIRYLGSDNLLYDERPVRAIHANYNVWLRELAQTINAGLGTSAILEVPQAYASAAPAPVAPAVVAAGAVATGAVAAGAPRAAAADGMPTPGTQWKYGYRDRQYDRGEKFFTVDVAGVEQARVRERLSTDGAGASETVIDADKVAFATRQFGPSTSFVELTPYPRELQKTSQPPPGYPAQGVSMWKITAPKFAEEEVRVPAGTFRTLRVEITGTSSTTGGSFATAAARFSYVAWYSRELNRYVKIQHQTWNRQNARIGDEHVQLVGYQPGK